MSQKALADVHTYDLCVVLLNYRTPEAVLVAATSVLVDLPTNSFLAIVDNASNDGSAEKIQAFLEDRSDDRAALFISPVNTGFSGGNNFGMQQVQAKRYMLLNSDTKVHKGALSALLAAADKNPKVGLVAPKLVGDDGTTQNSLFQDLSPLREFIGVANTGLLTRILYNRPFAEAVGSQTGDPGWVSFAAVLLTEAALSQVGTMDDGFFMYFEDADYGAAVRRAGLECIAVPAARVIHYRGGSSPVKARIKSGERLPRYFHAARTLYLFKNYGRLGLVAANLLWTLGWIINVVRRRFGAPRSTCRAQERDIWTNFWSPMRVDHERLERPAVPTDHTQARAPDA